ncbi:uncharacterized protein LACBIDRAFT_324306 [Laccaria bicolor S238N-H82]|uniref:Predicted protein n=1 Tax=Laccaria bicolor (strain S238N-H82 / ATCC MYA-4686) TaxID=486041 RepID=B0D1E2_LACBS|nr:uncharacterized protein LACBIDRAFT_324306 [Laccaria bicolor S238N-H82]EDR11985.1 predicted protein [Laccaria bicolor S238N-H82]|eukprot:XP_001877882.1 predicted protein [Laccaria bicolor S238N-H82]
MTIIVFQSNGQSAKQLSVTQHDSLGKSKPMLLSSGRALTHCIAPHQTLGQYDGVVLRKRCNDNSIQSCDHWYTYFGLQATRMIRTWARYPRRRPAKNWLLLHLFMISSVTSFHPPLTSENEREQRKESADRDSYDSVNEEWKSELDESLGHGTAQKVGTAAFDLAELHHTTLEGTG